MADYVAFNTNNTTGSFSGYTTVTGGGVSGWHTVATTTVDPLGVMQAEIDRMKVQLEEAVALMEKLDIEARYWHIKAEALQRLLDET